MRQPTHSRDRPQLSPDFRNPMNRQVIDPRCRSRRPYSHGRWFSRTSWLGAAPDTLANAVHRSDSQCPLCGSRPPRQQPPRLTAKARVLPTASQHVTTAMCHNQTQAVTGKHVKLKLQSSHSSRLAYRRRVWSVSPAHDACCWEQKHRDSRFSDTAGSTMSLHHVWLTLRR